MNFKQKKIRSYNLKQLWKLLILGFTRVILTLKGDWYRKFILGFGILFIIILVSGSTLAWYFYHGIYLNNQTIKTESTHFLDFNSSILKKDSNGNINLLLLGRGGGQHDGSDLTDAFIIASINTKRKSVAMMSVPRDLWVKIPSYRGKTAKLNTVFEFAKKKFYKDEKKALEVVRRQGEKISGLDIQYVIMINFNGFTNFVEAIGGIDVVLKKDFLDTQYPRADWNGWETFWLPRGKNHLTGYNTLKFVRSRHSSSDFSRSQRQQMVLASIKEKALSMGILTNPSKLKEILNIISTAILTDLNTNELINLMFLIKDIPRTNLITAVLNNACIMENSCHLGGFLYNPERRFFDGGSVLLPVGANVFNLDNYDSIKKFGQILFYHPEVYIQKVKINIYNSTKKSGLAAKLRNKLATFGFKVEQIGGTETKKVSDQTKIYVPQSKIFAQVVGALGLVLDAPVIKLAPPASTTLDNNADIYIVLGSDFR